jgi:membrane glycosyltransferase
MPLDVYQRNTLLSDPIALSRLHFAVWTAPDAHADWATRRSGITS